MSGSLPHSRGRQLDRVTDADVGHAATEITRHDRIDVLVGRIGIVLEQRGRLHDLTRLAVTALRNLQVSPRCLQRMLALRVKTPPLLGGGWGGGGAARAA